jgi:hypothetical protein
MKNIVKFLWFLFSFAAAIKNGSDNLTPAKEQLIKDDEYFNILSLDGAGMNGLVTAKLLSLIEQYAYNYTEYEDLI